MIHSTELEIVHLNHNKMLLWFYISEIKDIKNLQALLTTNSIFTYLQAELEHVERNKQNLKPFIYKHIICEKVIQKERIHHVQCNFEYHPTQFI